MTTRETVIPAALWCLRSLYLLTPASFCHLHRWLSVSGQYSFSILHEGKLKWESICGCVQLVCHFTTMSKTNIIIVHLCSFAPYPSPSVFWLLSWWLPFLVLVDCCQVVATNTHSQHACTHAQNSHKTDASSNTHTHTRTQASYTNVYSVTRCFSYLLNWCHVHHAQKKKLKTWRTLTDTLNEQTAPALLLAVLGSTDISMYFCDVSVWLL